VSAIESCRFEQQVLEAVRSGEWTSALREHARTCDECAAAVAISPWMSSFSATDFRERPLPDPAIVWMKAQLLRGTATVERAARPLQIAQFVAYFVVAAGWAALLTWKWNVIQGLVGTFTPAGIAQSGGSLSMAFFVGVFLLGSATIVLALHTILAEE
jgi:hypothetical protein